MARSLAVYTFGRMFRRYCSRAGLALGALVIVISLGAAAADAGQFSESLYSGLKWRLIGPFRGGRAIAAAGVPGDPNVYYFGAVGGGVWKTTDGGRVWKPIFDAEPIASIGAIAVAPSDPKVIYVGTGEADLRSDISSGDGVYKSIDAGRTWEHMGLEDSRAIGRILVDPRDPNVVLVAALGHPYGPNAERGVFRSADGGRTWQKALYKDENTGAIDLSFDPGNARVVYAALWQVRRPPWSVYGPIEGPGGGLYKSTDGGLNWNQLSGNGLPASTRRIGISVAYGSEGRSVYALIDTPEARDRGLYRSEDAGSTWRHVSADARIDGRAWYFSGVFVDPRDANTVYVANTGLYRSTDGGATFVTIKGAPGGDDYHFLWIDPTDSRRMIVASDQGTVVSVDKGETWSSWYSQPTAQLYHVITDNQFPYHVYGAQQDSGSVEVSSRSDSPEISFRDWQPSAGGESGYLAPQPDDPGVVFGGDSGGSVEKFWKATHQVQDVSPALGGFASFNRPPGCYSGAGYRFTWTSPLVFSVRPPRALFLGSQVLLKTLDGGHSWQIASPDLTRAATAAPQPPPGAGPADFEKVTGCGVIYTIAPSPLRADEIWVGTDDGLIQLTLDNGKSWKNVTPSALGPWSHVSLMDASHFEAGAAYAAIDRHRLDDYRPHILRTRDYGRTWQEVDQGLPATSYIHVVREDPERRGLLYAGSEIGVFVSFDDGDHWQSLQLNLPAAPIHDLVVQGDDLVVATHGRSFWILDDVTPLRQLSRQVAESDVYLFKPATAIRLHPRPFEGTPLPPETPTGENPPDGALIDYSLKQAPAGDVRLEILDARGRPIRQFSSAEKPPAPPRPPVVTSNWLPRPAVVTREPGLNRFVWDLRYAAPTGGGFGFFAPRGVMVLPGSYQVRLTVGDRSQTQPLEVKLDPRVKTPRADLENQLQFEQQVLGSISDSNRFLAEMRELGSKLDALGTSLAAKPEAKPVAAETEALRKKLAALSGDSGGAPGTAGAESPHLAQTLRTLTEVLSVASSADAAPTEQCEEAARKAQNQLEAVRTAWTELKAKDLAALNELLHKNGLAAIPPPPEY